MSSFFEALKKLNPNAKIFNQDPKETFDSISQTAKHLIDKKIAELTAYCIAEITLNHTQQKATVREELHPLLDKLTQQSIAQFYVNLQLKRQLEHMKLQKRLAEYFPNDYPENKKETNK